MYLVYHVRFALRGLCGRCPVRFRCVHSDSSFFLSPLNWFKFYRGDADDRLHDGIDVKNIRPANLQEVVMAQRKKHWRGYNKNKLTVQTDIAKATHASAKCPVLNYSVPVGR